MSQSTACFCAIDSFSLVPSNGSFSKFSRYLAKELSFFPHPILKTVLLDCFLSLATFFFEDMPTQHEGYWVVLVALGVALRI
jgi:hypothetical protein